ncbi:MAG: Gfo/Idh/MocA family oxidoreductase [Thermoguttaceae bacterium]|nr:Gfo/Idh/MocA family oxidoreductase [Thermoguttaceae bacterium]
MNLTPENKNIGEANFRAVMASPNMRGEFFREWLKIKNDPNDTTTRGGYYYGYTVPEKPVKIGIIGTGDEGSVLLGACNPAFVDIVAIADIRSYNRWRAFNGDVTASPKGRKVRRGLYRVYSECDEKFRKTKEEVDAQVKVFKDYHELLAAKDELGIEAVLIALPLHLHHKAAIEAMNAGLHVLTEKLMAHDIAKCKDMGRVAARLHKHMATGHQRHYSVLYNNAIEAIEQGLLGKIHYIRAQWHRNNQPGNDSWQPPLPEAVINQKDGKYTENDLVLLNGIKKKKEAHEKKKEGFVKELAKLDGQIKACDDKAVALRESGDKFAIRMNEIAREKLVANKARIEGVELPLITKQIEQFDQQLNDEIAIPLDENSNYRAHTLVDGKGNTTYVAPAAEELYRWRLWETTSAGVMAELGSHQLDAAGIFISAMYGDGKHHHPINVTAFSNRSVFNKRKDKDGNYVLLNDRDIEDHMTCIYEYAAPGYEKDPRQKVAVAYSAINGNDFGGYGEVVMGTTGTLQIDREENAYLWYTYEVNQYAHVERGGESKVAGFKAPEYTLKPTSDDDFKNQKMDEVLGTEALNDLSLGYTEEIEHFAYCIRTNPEPNYKTDDPAKMMHCEPKVAMADAIMALTANISARVGQTIEFKDEWFDVFNDATPENDFRPEGTPEIKPTEAVPAGFGNVPAEAPAPAPAAEAPAPAPAAEAPAPAPAAEAPAPAPAAEAPAPAPAAEAPAPAAEAPAPAAN